MIPYAHITAKADRRWTSRLLDRLVAPDLPKDELDDLVGALQAASDPRSVGSLEAVVCDAARPEGIRRAASSVLRGMQYLVPDVPEGKLRRWWRDGDALLRRHALLCMDAVDCPDVVLRVAGDPGHGLHAAALGRMEFFFDLPEHEGIKVAALAHPDAGVREVAAYVLLWDEPVSAEGPLIRAAADPVPEVAAEAANTLGYYPSLETVRCLHGLLDHPAGKVREEARESFDAIRNEFLLRLCSRDRPVARHIRSWLRPVWEMLAFTDDDLRPDEEEGPSVRQGGAKEAVPVPELLALLADPDASPRVLGDRLRDNAWPAYGEGDRDRLRPVLLKHPDPLVRERAALALEAWRDVPGLVGLVRDPDLLVCKSAVYHLGRLPPSPGIADLAWGHLHRPDVLGVHATETLDTLVRHAAPVESVRRLGWIAGDHGRRESLRVAAVDHLAELGAGEEIQQLAGLLVEPPMVTWGLHVALLDAITNLRLLGPDISHLREVDSLHVQAAVARFGA
jgi:HEAT repeat protein